jgi:hypothetical protein
MTFIGKVFTVAIFVMSLVFMSLSVVVFATHKNWKMRVMNDTATDEYELGLVHQLAHLNETNNNLRDELDGLSNELAFEKTARRHRIAVLETKRQELADLLERKQRDLDTANSAKELAIDAAKLAEENAKALRAEVDELRDEIRVAQGARDKLFLEVVDLTDKLHGSIGLERALKERQNDLLAEVSRYKLVMDKLGVNPNMSVEKIPPPVDGVVTAVSSKNLIEISLGSDDGLKTGHRLEVFRNNLYLGYAVVLKTDPDRSVAQVDEKSQRGLIKVQDRVATKLSSTGTG